MRRDKRENKDVKENKKVLSVIGFLLSITLLSIAIILSINEESNQEQAKLNRNLSITNTATNTITKKVSSELSKTINEVKQENKIESNQTNNNVENNIKTYEETKINNEDDSNKNNKESNNSKNEVEENKNTTEFIKPVDGEIIKSFAMDSLIYSETLQEWITHRGIDIKAEKTTVVKAVANGTIKSIKEDPRYGLSITIEHQNGFTTVYSSLLSSVFVKEGDKVEQGQSIGTVGNSAIFETSDGAHLHFELLKNGEYVNPDIYIK